MKKLYLLAACIAVLCGCSKDPEVQESDGLKVSKAVQSVTLNIVFTSGSTTYVGPNGVGVQYPFVQFHCPDASRYGVTQIDVSLRDVYVVYLPDALSESFQSVASMQMIDASTGYSEVAPFRLIGGSYVDLNSIRVQSSGQYSFTFNVTGISVGSSGGGSGSGGGEGGGGFPQEPLPGDTFLLSRLKPIGM